MICPFRKSLQLSLFVAAVCLLTLPAAATLSQEKTPARQVALTITITDKNRRYVDGLSKGQVTVLDEKIPQELILLKQEENAPTSIGFVLDVSTLKLGTILSGATELVRQFMAASAPANEYFIAAFDATPNLVSDFTRDRNQIITRFAALAKANSSKKAALYDAIRMSIEKVKAGTNPKHVLLLISDDRDNGSNLKRSELVELLKNSDVLLYAIRITAPGDHNVHSSVLDELCSTTGGIALYPTSPAEFMDAFEMLAVELRHQYSAAFQPTGSTKDTGWHRLEFNVKPLEWKENPSAKAVKKLPLFARSRAGYYLGP